MYDEGRNTDETREGLTSQARCDAARRVKLQWAWARGVGPTQDPAGATGEPANGNSRGRRTTGPRQIARDA